MKPNPKCPSFVFREIGKVHWIYLDSFTVTTKRGAKFLIYPFEYESIPPSVQIDEIFVPEPMRRRGIATDAMIALCNLADKYHIRLSGGPVGWSEGEWSSKFAEWVLRFGFELDPSPFLPRVDDPAAFYVCRRPKLNAKT